ncbi:MAG: hypothetical protein KatS3mg076_1017 [Candidatus Binatia bacterium]|nr:MAG: hypothetical protein KatS3mg076_1017 [Candidatus Binatia bacterium]
MVERIVTDFRRQGYPSYEKIDEEGQAKPCVYGVAWVNEDTLRTIEKRGGRPTGPKGEPLDGSTRPGSG